ncbi:hypothetical protein evm_011939 [Chilo suppressalis]|nr:hypothetical protein evm_011939 [Chilo suppressalis]
MTMFLVFLLVISTTIGVGGVDCIHDGNGLCITPCPPDTYTYSPGCQVVMSQRTCRSPRSRPMGFMCDYWRCDCHKPLVWDKAASKCVMFEDCSDQSQNVLIM